MKFFFLFISFIMSVLSLLMAAQGVTDADDIIILYGCYALLINSLGFAVIIDKIEDRK